MTISNYLPEQAELLSGIFLTALYTNVCTKATVLINQACFSVLSHKNYDQPF